MPASIVVAPWVDGSDPHWTRCDSYIPYHFASVPFPFPPRSCFRGQGSFPTKADADATRQVDNMAVQDAAQQDDNTVGWNFQMQATLQLMKTQHALKEEGKQGQVQARVAREASKDARREEEKRWRLDMDHARAEGARQRALEEEGHRRDRQHQVLANERHQQAMDARKRESEAAEARAKAQLWRQTRDSWMGRLSQENEKQAAHRTARRTSWAEAQRGRLRVKEMQHLEASNERALSVEELRQTGQQRRSDASAEEASRRQGTRELWESLEAELWKAEHAKRVSEVRRHTLPFPASPTPMPLTHPHPPPTAYRLPPITHHPPPTTHHLPPTTYRLPRHPRHPRHPHLPHLHAQHRHPSCS